MGAGDAPTVEKPVVVGKRRSEAGDVAAVEDYSVFASGSSAGDGVAVCGSMAGGAGGEPRGFSSVGWDHYAAGRVGAVSGVWGRVTGLKPCLLSR